MPKLFLDVSPDESPPNPPGVRDLTTVAQDYLKTIWSAQEWSHEKVSTKLLAERIGVSASTASESIRRLADQGLVDHEKYGAVTLTERGGRLAALAVVRRHRLLETFLMQELGYSWDEVHDEAEILEHAISDMMLDRIDAKLGHPTRDPHGDPIPNADGRVPTPPGAAAIGMRRRRTRHGCANLRCRSGNAALLRHRRHQLGLAPEGAGPARLRRHDLGVGRILRRRSQHRGPGKPCRSSYLGRRLDL